MSLQAMPLYGAPLLLAGLLWAESTGRPRSILIFKAPLSCLFVLVALLADKPLPTYHPLMLAGLLLGLVGDVCLALPGKQAFRAGLVAFLAGHALYVAAFAWLVGFSRWLGWPLVGIALVGVGVFLWLRRRAESMVAPVAAYILVISLMLAGAWAVHANAALSPRAAACVLVGAVLFYFSDLLIARQRFVKTEYLNRLLGLPLYYAGQFLLALSADASL